MGLSNISFGMPQRPYLNGQFLTMALACGLTTPIMNPLNYPAKKAFVSSTTLLGWDPGSAQFIKEYGYEDETSAPGNSAPKGPEKKSFDSNDPLANIRACVEQGEKEAIVELVKKALADGMDPLDITKKGLSEAMNVVGDKFGSGKLFLPQVMLAAETMQAAFNTIKEIIPASESLDKGTVVVQAIKDNKAALVGICSLMTTTMPQIDNTIAAIRAAGLKTKVMVGGAVVSQDYADQAGADIYAKDGIAAVNHANDFFETLEK